MAPAAVAAPVIYSDRTAFNDALALLSATATIQHFEGIDPDSWGTFVGDAVPAGWSFTIGGVTTTSSDFLFAGHDYGAGNTYLSSGFAAAEDAGSRRLTISLPANYRAIGFDLLEYQSPDTAGTDPITVSALGASQTLDNSPTSETPEFWGVIDASGAGSVLTIERSLQVAYPLAFDNVTYALEIPEPMSGVLLLGGLLMLRRARRRS
jgi:hypothetical protein